MSVGVGVDVGAATVTIAAVSRRGGSLALEYLRHVSLLELTGDEEPEHSAVAAGVARQLREDGLRARSVQLGVSGRDAIIRYSHLPPMPAWRLKLLMELEIDDVAERTGEPLSADYRVLPIEGDGNVVLVALAKDARVEQAVEAFEKAGLEVSGAVPQPVATGDCFRFLGEADGRTVLVVDIGRRSTEVSIVEDGELVFARSVALGGEAFTERMAKSLGLDRDEAEEQKVSGEGLSDDPTLLRGPTDQLASMVRASLDFARAQLRRPTLAVDAVAVSGGGSRVPGLVEALGEAVGQPAETFDPAAHIALERADKGTREAAEVDGCAAAAAIGLAFSAVLPGATRLELLPLSVKQRLERKHRTVWLYAAAGALGLALLVTYGFALWSYTGEQGRSEALGQALSGASQRVARHEERVTGNDEREADLRALAERARPGFHLAALLRTLGEVTPPEIALSAGSMSRDASGAVRFEFSGVSDDGQGNGVLAMRALERALLDDPHVAEAQVQPEGLEGSARRFKLRVVPKGNPGAEPAAAAQEGS